MKNIDNHCVSCGIPFKPGMVRNHSSLFNSDQAWVLCTDCKDSEEIAMDEAGTNNVPWLFNGYLSNIEELDLKPVS